MNAIKPSTILEGESLVVFVEESQLRPEDEITVSELPAKGESPKIQKMKVCVTLTLTLLLVCTPFLL